MERDEIEDSRVEGSPIIIIIYRHYYPIITVHYFLITHNVRMQPLQDKSVIIRLFERLL